MYRNILVAYNGSPESQHALSECIHLAPGPATGVHLLGVASPPPPVLIGDFTSMALLDSDAELEAAREKMVQTLSAGLTLLRAAGLNVISHVEVGDPIDVIAEAANRLKIDLIILGHPHHRSWTARWWRGSTDRLLIDKVSCSILIASMPRSRDGGA